MYYYDHSVEFPCLHCQPNSYIRMVQHLIERCLILNMSRDECINALAHHARISPVITLTVWRELLKENKDFFQAYFPTTVFHSRLDYFPKYHPPRFRRRRQWRP